MAINNFLRFLGTSIASNFKPLSVPYRLNLAVTYKCNSRCEMCGIWKKETDDLEMTPREVRSFFTQNPFFQWVTVTGGEIFLRKDILQIMSAIIESSPRLYLLNFPTNGLSPDIVEEGVRDLLKMRPNRVMVSVSLDGYAELNDKIRGLDGAFEKSIETYKRLRKLKSRNFGVMLGMTLSNSNSEYLTETFDAVKKSIKDFTWKDLHVNVSQKSSHYYGNEELAEYDPGNILKTLETFMKLKGFPTNAVEVMDLSYQRLSKGFLTTGITPVPCAALRSSCFIDPFWNLYPCTMFSEKMANLRETNFNFKSCWRSKETNNRRKDIRKGNCPQCWTPCEAYQSILARLYDFRALLLGNNGNKP